MVRFPEQDPKEPPIIPETSLQQKWRADHTRELTARRTWKSTQMALEATCSRFKTFLIREFGNDYVSALMEEYGDVDISKENDSRYVSAIKTLQGPNGMPEIMPPTPPADDALDSDVEAFNTAMEAYNAEVEVRKTYLGMPVPDAQTATRILILIRNLRQYKDVAKKARDDAMSYATKSMMNGEVPPAPMLRAISKNARIWKSGEGIVDRKIDWNKYGISNDDPRRWKPANAAFQPIYTMWYEPELRATISTEYGAWVKNRDAVKAGQAPIGPFTTWRSVFLLFCERVYGLKYDRLGLYVSPSPNSKVYIGQILLFAAKSYSRNADPLHYWSTQSKYRLNATDYGAKGVVVELCLVEAKIGAPTGASMVVAIYPPGTTRGQAIANTRPYYPHVMDVETGNNPQLDTMVATATTPTHIKNASAEFMKQPQSSRDGYRYVAVTRTILAFPGNILYKKAEMKGITSVSQFALAFRKDSPMRGVPDLMQHLLGWGKTTLPFNEAEGHWKWSDYITNDTMKQMVLGVPNKHPDARMITTLDIVLVPSYFEDGIKAIEQEMKQSAEAVEKADWDSASEAFNNQIKLKEWNNTSAALVALTSGHWAAEKNWLRSKTSLHGGYHTNEMFGAMGIPLRVTLGNVSAKLKAHNLFDLSGLKTVYSGAVNDKDDIVRIITNFQESFPGVAELVMPDTKDISNMAPSSRPFHTNVTSLSVAPCVNIPSIAKGEFGSYIVRRIPIRTNGISGKQYTFGGFTLNTAMLEFATNDFSMEMPETSIGGASLPLVVGGLAVAGLLTYAGYGGISSRNDSTKS